VTPPLATHAARLAAAVWYGNHFLRWPLWPLGQLYRGLAAARRTAYRCGVLETHELEVPVVVVGNLSVGGTGKTPFIVWLTSELTARGLRVGIVARGYRGRAAEWPQTVTAESDAQAVGDEPVLLALRTSCPVGAGPDRVAAARRLIADHDLDVILSDDGLQHYRLGRKLEIAVVDGERGMGNGLCLPAGPLREPPIRLRSVDAIVVNGGTWGHAGVFRAEARIQRVYRLADGAERPIEAFRGALVHAVAGIGNPQRFFDLLEDAGLTIEPHALPDHAEIAARDLKFEEAGAVLVTEKDAVKCRAIAHDGVWCVAVDLAFTPDTAARLMRIVLPEIGGPHGL
jgi:tetraacyldisaccharide 4'-kinase